MHFENIDSLNSPARTSIKVSWSSVKWTFARTILPYFITEFIFRWISSDNSAQTILLLIQKYLCYELVCNSSQTNFARWFENKFINVRAHNARYMEDMFVSWTRVCSVDIESNERVKLRILVVTHWIICNQTRC